MTGSRTQSGPAPTYLRITLGEGTPTPTQSHQADRPASADSMPRAGPASRPFVLATLRALRLDPGPNPVLSTRSPKTSKTTAQQPLDTPRPFRDDSALDAGGADDLEQAATEEFRKHPDHAVITAVSMSNSPSRPHSRHSFLRRWPCVPRTGARTVW